MENASKALIMAGSILLAMLIIGAFGLMFDSIRDLKNTEATTEDVKKLAEYNKRIETFNRNGLYGSEILSLANLIADYNIRQSDLKGYTEINLKVTITKKIVDAEYMTEEEYDYKNVIQRYEELENAVNINKNKTYEIGGERYTAEKISGMNLAEIRELENKSEKSSEEIMGYADDYVKLKSELYEFKVKKFGTPIVNYDSSTGRVTKMEFTEEGKEG